MMPKIALTTVGRFVVILAWFLLTSSAQAQTVTEGAPGVTATATATAVPAPGEVSAFTALAVEIERAVAHQRELEVLSEEQARRRTELAAASDVAAEQIAALAAQVSEVSSGGGDADALFERIVGHLRPERSRLGLALDSFADPLLVSRWRSSLDVTLFAAESLQNDVGRLDELAAEIRAAEDSLTFFEQESRWLETDHAGRQMMGLNQLRLKSLQALSRSRRREVLGLTSEGVEQFFGEVQQLRLEARLLWVSRYRMIDEAGARVHDVFVLGSLTYTILKVMVVIFIGLWLRRRWKALFEHWYQGSVLSKRTVRGRRRAAAILNTVEGVAPWAVVLVVISGLVWALGEAADWPGVVVPMTVAMFYAAYRLAVDIFVTALVGAAHHYNLDMPPDLEDKLITSVRWLMRVVGAITVVVLFARQFMGLGYLYHVTVEMGWIAVVGTLLVILLAWRRPMADTFLRLHPNGSLAAVVRASRNRWFAVLVAPASFLWLAGRATIAVAKDFALGFEETGKILAFLFRRKVEKQAERRGYAEGEVADLAPELREAFSSDAVERGGAVVAHFPGLEQLHQEISDWRAGACAGSVVLVGERGIGKTTWLNQVKREDVTVTRCELARPVSSRDELFDCLSEVLDLGESFTSAAEMAAALEGGEQRLVILDLTQHLFLTKVGGYGAFEAFAELVNRTRLKVFWLCSMSAYAWRHLLAVRPDSAVFRVKIELGPWNDVQIRQLIRQRAETSGVRFNYADLVVGDMEGISTRASLIESEEGYARLLWDYTDGNPRAALHFFLRSLDSERPERVKVRLFRSPNPTRLEEGGEMGLFLLAAIITHHSIKIEDLAEVTRFPLQTCFIQLDRLRDFGAVSSGDDGLYRITTAWHRAAVRLLKRRNVLPD